MTMPVLIQKYQKKVALAKLQKAYSTLTNALELSKIENGKVTTWDFSDLEDIIKNNIAKYIKHVKVYGPLSNMTPLCHEKQVTNVYDGYTYSWFEGMPIRTPFSYNNNNWSVLTNDEVCIGISEYDGLNYITIDINSSINPPNVAGKDLFFFYFSNGEIKPAGDDRENPSSPDQVNNCNIKAERGGYVCAAKIIKDGWTMKDDYPW